VGVADVSDPTRPGQFITSFDLPDFPIGFGSSLIIYNGLAYFVHVGSPVTGMGAGLRVINYMPMDNLRVPPTVSLQTGATNNGIEEGKQLRVTALATDDVQVRNVEFYRDGIKIATDGNFPFECWFDAPLIVPGTNSFTLRARASDTAGQATFSEPITIQLLPAP
jgi:hypothetical protein